MEKICCIEGCTNPVRGHSARGMCRTHYGRFLKYGDPLEPSHWRPKERGACSVEGCNEPHYGKGYCSKHYYQVKRYGKPINPNEDTVSLPGEKWHKVVGFEEQYAVSNLGRIKSFRYKNGYLVRIMSPSVVHGYLRVELRKEGKKISVGVHRLVAEAFIPNLENKPIVNHKNGRKQDNRVENLEWATNSENVSHAFRVLGVKAHGGKPPRMVRNIETGKIYQSISEVETDGYRRSSVISCCQGKYHTSKGCHWEYL